MRFVCYNLYMSSAEQLYPENAHYCYPIPGTFTDTVFTELFDQADELLRAGELKHPTVVAAAAVCVERCSRLEQCQEIAKEWKRTGRVTGIAVNGKPPYVVGGSLLYVDEQNFRQVVPIALSETQVDLQPLQAPAEPECDLVIADESVEVDGGEPETVPDAQDASLQETLSVASVNANSKMPKPRRSLREINAPWIASVDKSELSRLQLESVKPQVVYVLSLLVSNAGYELSFSELYANYQDVVGQEVRPEEFAYVMKEVLGLVRQHQTLASRISFRTIPKGNWTTEGMFRWQNRRHTFSSDGVL